jgi:hypothetical protein
MTYSLLSDNMLSVGGSSENLSGLLVVGPDFKFTVIPRAAHCIRSASYIMLWFSRASSAVDFAGHNLD